MRKLLVLLLIGAVAALSFADDALVLPKGVFRIYETNTYASFDQEFDADGEKVDTVKTQVFILGAALEYGVTDWISAAFQWAPGWGVWSNIEDVPLPNPDAHAKGLYDLFAGAKVQVIRPKAPVVQESMRLALAAGAVIPLPGPDWDEQVTNFGAGDPYIMSAADKHAFGLGGRAYFDYVLNEMFFLNLYSEFIYYLGKPPAKETDILAYMGDDPGDVEYGYDLTLEVEPHFERQLTPGLKLGVGLPVTYTMAPAAIADGVEDSDGPSYLLTLGPNVSMFFMKAPVPLEFEASYTLPLMGKNSNAANIFTLQIKSYLKF